MPAIGTQRGPAHDCRIMFPMLSGPVALPGLNDSKIRCTDSTEVTIDDELKALAEMLNETNAGEFFKSRVVRKKKYSLKMIALSTS